MEVAIVPTGHRGRQKFTRCQGSSHTDVPLATTCPADDAAYRRALDCPGVLSPTDRSWPCGMAADADRLPHPVSRTAMGQLVFAEFKAPAT